MMKLILVSLSCLFILNFLSKEYLQMINQLFILMILMFFLGSVPLNILGGWGLIYYTMGMDYFSWVLVILSLWIMFLMGMSSSKSMLSGNFGYYFYLMSFILVVLVLIFCSMNLMMFYLFFEASLIPIFLLILGWGYQVERIQAGWFMMLYTLVGSMPLLLGILYIYWMEKILMMDMSLINLSGGGVLYLSLVVAFLVKMPMYLVHLWLPKAHVEAPLVGSMILAGVMLKLGSYGLVRVMWMVQELSVQFNKWLILLSILGSLVSSLICLCQVDLKMLVAYSSVVHMGAMMAGLMTLNSWGVMGGIFMMVAHGLCSSGMFVLVNINYERLLSRSLYLNKGLMILYPSLTFMWFLLCSSNLSFPPSLNLFSEIFLINSLVKWSKSVMVILLFLMFFSACYTLYLFAFSQHGKNGGIKSALKIINGSDFMVLLLHWIPLNCLFLMMEVMF